MGVTNYHTYNGRICSESSGGVTTAYLTDALGSVTATVDSAGVVQNTYRYKPYGGLLAKTGTAADPAYLWTGDTGSRATGLAQAGQYNEARHYGAESGSWTTVDPLWPAQPPYEYSAGNATTMSDSRGLGPDIRYSCGGSPYKGKVVGVLEAICNDIVDCWNDSACNDKLVECWVKSGASKSDADAGVTCMVGYCASYHPISIVCGGWPLCRGGQCGGHYAVRFGSTCTFTVCDPGISGCSDVGDTAVHELSHCCGSTDWGGTDDEGAQGQAERIAVCYMDTLRKRGLEKYRARHKGKHRASGGCD